MKNIVVFFSFFFITVFSVLVFSTPANAVEYTYIVQSKVNTASSATAACRMYFSGNKYGDKFTGITGFSQVQPTSAVFYCKYVTAQGGDRQVQGSRFGTYPSEDDYEGGGGDFGGGGAGGSWGDDGDGGTGCSPCDQLTKINNKLNRLHDINITSIDNSIIDMKTIIENIDNSINNLDITEISETLVTVDNSLTSIITNIENNNITNNTWFETVNNQITSIVNNQTTNNENIQNIVNEMGDINNKLTEYSLKLGNIELAIGDIDLSLKNTNRLAVDLGLDLDLIKNDLALGNKDHTKKLNEIIDLLAECVPNETNTCPDGSQYDDTELIALLTDLQNFIKADFVPDTESTKVEVTDLTDIELDRDLIKFGVAQCPPDSEFNTVVNGFSFAGGFKHKPLCDFFTMLAPFVKAFGGFSAALVLGGGLRR